MLTGNDIKRLMAEGASEGLVRAAREVLHAAERDAPPTNPTDDPDPSATLRQEGRVVVENGGRSVRIVFDGPYAAKQHESQGFEHPHGGSAKFLERNAKAIVPRLPGIVASEVRARVKG